MLKESILSSDSSLKMNVLDYVSKFRDGYIKLVLWRGIH